MYHAEVNLLRGMGHDVVEYCKDNRDLPDKAGLGTALSSIWSRVCRKEIDAVIRRTRPNLVHFHNTHPVITPSAYYAAAAHDLPVVQTLHNFRFVCPDALLFRNGNVCEECIGKPLAWPSVLHGCYRSSHAASFAVASTLAFHRALGTWTSRIHRYIALTSFAKAKFVEGGMPHDRIAVKPNFAFDTAVADQPDATRVGALYVGRLSAEKGIATLLAAWEKLAVPLQIIGDGPLLSLVRKSAKPHIRSSGRQSAEQVVAAMRESAVLVLPSECYEGFAVVIAEAFCQGLPVIASRLGAMAEAIIDGQFGLLFTPGDALDLAAKIQWATDNPVAMAAMGVKARRRYEERYSQEVNYNELMRIYGEAIQEQRNNTPSGSRQKLKRIVSPT